MLVPHAICSIDDVKHYLAGTVDYGNDSLIAMMINGLSESFQVDTGRKLLVSERTEFFSSATHVYIASFALEAPPVEPGSVSVYLDTSGNFSPGIQLVEGVDYLVFHDQGVIRFIRPGAVWEAGWPSRARAILEGDPFYPMGTPTDTFGVPRGGKTIKVVYRGGLVKPRPGPPDKPIISTGPGSLSGEYRYSIAVKDSSGVVSVATRPVSVVLSSNKTTLVLPAVGSGNKIIVYRTPANVSTMFFLTEVNGSTLPVTIDDSAPDSALDDAITPFSYGPYVVPEDIRLAAAQQIADWISRGASVTITQQSDSFGRRVYDASQYTAMMNRVISNYKLVRWP
ncbi:MAG: hypothetical protein KatS3mg054_0111 [Chloroflexus sp.]|nr:MAG: hypothetical protein KatS3mg054_0111 [Chloroflexus sp.]